MNVVFDKKLSKVFKVGPNEIIDNIESENKLKATNEFKIKIFTVRGWRNEF